MFPRTPQNWHAMPAQEILPALASDAEGLSPEEAAARLRMYGPNTVPAAAAAAASAFARFVRQFHNVLIYVLLAAALVTGLMRHWTDMAVILCVVLINAIIGFIQEFRAEEALAAIRKLLSPYANVLRDGTQYIIPAAEVVPGDIILLTAGDKVPADVRLLTAHNLRLQESILTGESLDVKKSAHAIKADAALIERHCMAYSGTLVTSGQGTGVVVAAGKDTEIGRISTMLGNITIPTTPLTAKLARFSRWLAACIIVLSLGICAFGVMVRHLPLSDMFMVMIGIAVSAIPEGLPAVISIAMALGVRTMARRNAIVRHLPVIETLGSVSVICTDKTGTLTRNELSVSDIITANGVFAVTAVGYSPEGKVLFEDKEIVLEGHPVLHAIGHAAMLNNDAVIRESKGIWELNGDPTEGALLAFACKLGHTPEGLHEKWPRTDVIPFSAEARYMATLHHEVKGEGVIYVKGAPEQLLTMCSSQLSKDRQESLDVEYWQGQIDHLAKQGKRVLAVAQRSAPSAHRTLRHEDIAQGLTLLGLFGIMDAPRAEAAPAIAACLNAGITVKMITGDHVLTASSIGKMLGIPHSEQVMTGADMERLSEEALAKAVGGINIYARMYPEHKLRLVEALQQQGEVVAMTGDGVNDAPALKKADIGIAMGRQGTEVAKEAASLVLVDDNFASILHAVEEGRNIYQNIRRTIQFMLVTDGAEGLTLIVAMLAAFALPITPLQILWVNMVTAVTLSLAFAFAPYDPGVMRRPPVPLQAAIFARSDIFRMLGHFALIALGTVGIFLYEAGESNIPTARTIAVNTLVCFQIYYLWALFPLQKNRHALLPVILASVSVLMLQAGFTYIPRVQQIFATAPLEKLDWVKIALISASIAVWLISERLYQPCYKRCAKDVQHNSY